MKKTETIQTTHFAMKIARPDNLSPMRVGVMFHGWTGDENSMWAFTNQLNEDWLLIAPRALYPSKGPDKDGFSWVDQRIDHWPVFTDFLPAVDLISRDLLELSESFPEAEFAKLTVIGFSQGAAMSLVYSSVHKDKIAKLGLLSGFIPEGSEGYLPKQGNFPFQVFIGHGSKDEIVPVSKATEAEKLFAGKGYSPQICISDVGHRLGSDCFKALTNFLNQR